jgi:hypothetical protein
VKNLHSPASGTARREGAGLGERSIAPRVLVARARTAVAGSVDLDRQAQVGPVEVDLEAVEVRVDERFGELSRVEQLHERELCA